MDARARIAKGWVSKVLLLALAMGASACSTGTAAGTDGAASAGSGGAGGDGGTAGSGGAAGKTGGPPAGCTKGTVTCEGQTARTCDGEGGFESEMACDKACVPGKGCAACKPGEASCEGGVSTYCDETGSGLVKEACDPDMGLSCGPDGRCQGACSRAQLGRSYIGCEYFPTVTSNSTVYAGFHFAVTVSNAGAQAANVKVLRAGAMVEQRQVMPGALEVIELPWVPELKGDGTYHASALIKGGAYELKSDQPVSVYQFSPLEFELPTTPADCPDKHGSGKCDSYANDASLLLPGNTLSRQYVGASYVTFSLLAKGLGGNAIGNTPGLLAVTATEADTTVTVVAGGDALSGPGVNGMLKGDKQTFKLGRGDVLQLLSGAAYESDLTGCKDLPPDKLTGQVTSVCQVPPRYDLTGSLITSDKPVQVIGGHDCTFIPYNAFACDHLEESLFPLDTWGNEVLVTAPQSVAGAAAADGKPDKHVVRVISGVDGNVITLDPPLFPPGTLNKGQYADVSLTDVDLWVKGSGPLMVVQYMAGAEAVDPDHASTNSSMGDPSMSLAVPSAQYRTSYSFLAPASYTYSFVNVIAQDGVPVTLDDKPAGGSPSPIGQSGYSVVRLPVSGGAHRISAPKPFGIVVHGYGAYTSYMYPGGLDLEQLVDLK